MSANDGGRPTGNGAASQMTAGEDVAQMLPPTYPRGGDPRRRAQLRERLYHHRRAVLTLDRHLAVDKPPAVDCAVRHDGEHDWWGPCTGLNLTVAEREAAGARHPWRLAA
ncbi:hypothetical protein [Verrucosispora sp. WMMD1129]|uniref:hypothetical protein n=1 Tax=Verrucosispora sp. WMMD1129 TaxID=3016093 RepID=UPI00249BC273|nr:hypothetical protein [Verrucosispora sp. WMMD1129]WFE44279.1 hypothetical protein O7624_07985 [Verrucosispora sp. WMMD1129]